MSERLPRPDTADGNEDSSWTDDRLLGEVPLPTGPALVRLRLHQGEETYHEPHVARLVPSRHSTGTRFSVHARPYVLEPEITLTVGLFPTPEPTGAIGEVVDSAWEGLRHVEIGQAQAWYYPGDRLLVLWECYLFDRWQQDDPVQDPTLAVLWQGFETLLREHFLEAERVLTPAWEDIYDRPAWQHFLRQQGYEQESPAAFHKALTPHRPPDPHTS